MASIKGFQLKNVKQMLGREGYGCLASMYLHGKKIGIYEDYGDGGCEDVEYVSKEAEEEMMKVVIEYAKEHPNKFIVDLYHERPEQFKEECEETDDEIECIDRKHEWGIINPNFKTDLDVKKIAYEKYKLDWMLHHGYTLEDLVNSLSDCMEGVNEDFVVVFDIWESDYGFGSEIWACFDEFIDNEYQDKGYMKQLLNWEEYEKYEEDMKDE